MTVLALFNRILMSGLGAKFVEIHADNARLHDGVATEVLKILLEDFHDIIGEITNRMIFKFEE